MDRSRTASSGALSPNRHARTVFLLHFTSFLSLFASGVVWLAGIIWLFTSFIVLQNALKAPFCLPDSFISFYKRLIF